MTEISAIGLTLCAGSQPVTMTFSGRSMSTFSLIRSVRSTWWELTTVSASETRLSRAPMSPSAWATCDSAVSSAVRSASVAPVPEMFVASWSRTPGTVFAPTSVPLTSIRIVESLEIRVITGWSSPR